MCSEIAAIFSVGGAVDMIKILVQAFLVCEECDNKYETRAKLIRHKRDKHNYKIYGELPKVAPVCHDCEKPFANHDALNRHMEKYKRKCNQRYTFPHFMLCRFTYRYFSFTRQGKGKRNTSPSLIQPDSHSPPNHPLPNSSLLQSIPGNSGTSNHW